MSACLIGLSGTLLLGGSATASADSDSDSDSTSGGSGCGTRALKGRYVYAYDGWNVSDGETTPFAAAGTEYYDGAGRIETIESNSDNGDVSRRVTSTGRYTLKADCTGTSVYENADGTTSTYDLNVSPEGDTFTFVDVDEGVVASGSETRVSG